MAKKKARSKKGKHPRPGKKASGASVPRYKKTVPQPPKTASKSGKSTPQNTGGKGRAESGGPAGPDRSQKWKLRKAAVRQRFSAFSGNRECRLWTIRLLGVFLIAAGGVYCFANRIVKMPGWSKIGPAIQIACDQPSKGAMVYSETDGEGNTTLIFRQKDAAAIRSGASGQETAAESSGALPEGSGEEYHLWVCVRAYEDMPLRWSFDGGTGNVENYRIAQMAPENKQVFHVEKTDLTSGSDYAAVFRISFGGSYFNSADITLSEHPDHAVFRGNGYYLPRLPWIFPWFGYQVQSYQDLKSDFFSRDSSVNRSDIMGLSLNGQNMYCPFLEINANYLSPYLINQHDLEIALVKPDSETGYPLFSWTGYDFLLPLVQFYDKRWESAAKKNTLLGGVFVGLGVNVLLTSLDFFTEKEKRKR